MIIERITSAFDLAFALKGLVIPDFRHEEVSECQRALEMPAAQTNVRFGADILTSPRHVRFNPNNGRWAAHPSQHLAVGLRVHAPTVGDPRWTPRLDRMFPFVELAAIAARAKLTVV